MSTPQSDSNLATSRINGYIYDSKAAKLVKIEWFRSRGILISIVTLHQ